MHEETPLSVDQRREFLRCRATYDQCSSNEIGVASPIIGHDGRAFAAVQCSVSAHTWTRERIVADILPKLQDTANAISPAFHANHAGWD